MADLNPDFTTFFGPALDDAFTNVANDAVVIGYGDWRDPEGRDRLDLLTQVYFHVQFWIVQCSGIVGEPVIRSIWEQN